MTTFNACLGSEPTKPPEDDNRLLKIKKLKAKLINEEHRLVLMKKIRQSQTRPIAPQQHPNSSNINNNNSSNNQSSGALNSQAGQLKKLRFPQSGPLSLHKSQSASYHGTSSTSSTPNASTSMNQTPAHAHQRPKVNTLWNPPQQGRHPTPVGIAPPHVGNLSRQPITTPPNVVMMGNLAGQQSLLMNTNQRGAARSQQQSSSSTFNSKSSQAAQLLMQKRSAFKPSIQKQLEHTLMQQQQSQKHGQSGLGFSSSSSKRAVGITSPHVGNLSRQPITTPPNVVQDMRGSLSGQQSLLMNAGSLAAAARRPQQSQQQPLQQTSFNKSQAAQMLLQKRTAAKSAIHKQLEQTLMQLPQKHVQLDTKNPLDTQPLEKPFECSTCGTDFTPNWSWKRSNAVCENCVANHVKKSIKNSQASRIKSVLAKAAKQEQDMDARIMAEAATVVSSPSTTTSQHSLLQPVSHHQQQQQRSTPQQLWSRMNASPISTLNSNRSPSIQPPPPPPPQAAPINPNPLAAGLQPAALASLLQMNPQLSTLASLMTANNNTNTNTNQFAQVAALLMNQLTMNLWKR